MCFVPDYCRHCIGRRVCILESTIATLNGGIRVDSKDNDGNPVHSDFNSNHSLLTQKMRDFKLLFWNTCLDSIQSYILHNKMCEMF